MTEMYVTKRDGRKEELDLDKFHKVVFASTDNITGVSASEVEIKSHLQFYNGISTTNIQETLIKAAADLITEDTPNYQHVAGRLVSYNIRKEVYGCFTPCHVKELVEANTKSGFYDSEMINSYTDEEWDEINSFIKHERDENLTYVAMEQLRSKYLVQNRVTGQLFESPQVAYILISAVLFAEYDKETRLKWVKDYYDAISLHEISLPTPVMAGVRTQQRQFSSCVLIETDDSLDSINATTSSIVKYVSQRAGIGIGAGRIRALGSPIRDGLAYHTGVTPFFKLFQSAVNSCSQGGVRKGSATVYYPIWHYEVEDLLVLKNNKGTDDNRVRFLDYGLQFNKLMYERLIEGSHITLFSPHDVPDVLDAFYEGDYDKFKELYEKAEKNTHIRRNRVNAIDLFSQYVTERKQTGRIYLMNVDNANLQGSFKPEVAPVRMSNLCCVSGKTDIIVQFPSGTVQHIAIKDATPDMKVWSRDVQDEKNEFKQILAVAMTRKNAELMEIKLNGQKTSLVCTPDHKIYTSNLGYVEAQSLSNFDTLVVSDGETKPSYTVNALDYVEDVYDIEVEDNSNFFGNQILVHNCEITLPTTPLKDIYDDEGEIALCTLSAINWGVFKTPEDMQRACELAVRGLDALLSYQNYPIIAAQMSTISRRPIGVGIINFAYWLAKNDLTYSDKKALTLTDEWAQHWSYYLIKASADLAEEYGACPKSNETKYHDGVLPIDTYKRTVDELVKPKEYLDWDSLREQLKTNGIRNSTVMALMPSETSSQVANATNGIEPPRELVTIKQSKDGVLSQVVPEIRRLKNKYDLLWNQKSPTGYLQIMAVLQKYVDQAISVNTSYNPQFYEDEKIPMSAMLTDIMEFYKYGGKNLYYYQTFDGQGEVAVEEEDCDSCKI